MLKRMFDIVFALGVLVLLSPVLLVTSLAIWLHDFASPLYVAPRVGRGGTPFRMVKFRSMVVNADRTGVTSTSATDDRITPAGRIVRRYKLDELPQFWNVLCGDMSVVGPRPNVPSGVAVYTPEERRLLDVRPGITDMASIVFADEGEILHGHANADAAYDRLIRPWKSRLGLFYVANRSLRMDIRLVWLTAVALWSRPRALAGVSRVLATLGAPADLARTALRADPLG